MKPPLPADILPQCVADSLTEAELQLFGEEGNCYWKDLVTRLCEDTEQKDKAHQLLVDRVNEFIDGEGVPN